MLPDNMQNLFQIASMLGGLGKRVERLETLEAANIGDLCNCWCGIDYQAGPGSLVFNNIPDHSDDYPSLVIFYSILHDTASGNIDDITLELNNDVTGYEYIYLRLDANIGAGLGGASEVITASGQANMIIGKAPPDNIGIKKASGVIFFPRSQESPGTPVIALNACYNDQDSVGSRLSAGIYFGDNASYLGRLTRIEIDSPSNIATASWAALYEICQVLEEGGE